VADQPKASWTIFVCPDCGNQRRSYPCASCGSGLSSDEIEVVPASSPLPAGGLSEVEAEFKIAWRALQRIHGGGSAQWSKRQAREAIQAIHDLRKARLASAPNREERAEVHEDAAGRLYIGPNRKGKDL
jgi:hypothetical protein